jgi:hypothetical protein
MSKQSITVASFAAIFLVTASFTKRPKKALRFQRGMNLAPARFIEGKRTRSRKK